MKTLSDNEISPSSQQRVSVHPKPKSATGQAMLAASDFKPKPLPQTHSEQARQARVKIGQNPEQRRDNDMFAVSHKSRPGVRKQKEPTGEVLDHTLCGIAAYCRATGALRDGLSVGMNTHGCQPTQKSKKGTCGDDSPQPCSVRDSPRSLDCCHSCMFVASTDAQMN